MSKYVVFFDICSVPIYLITICTTLFRRMTKGRSNKLYLLIVLLSFASVVWELLENLAYLREPPYSAESILYAKIVDYLYFMTRQSIIVVYIFFEFSMTKTWYRIRKHWKKLLILLPYLVFLGMLATNEFTKFVFDVNAEQGYVRGSQIYVLYISAFFYMIGGFLYLVVQKHTLDTGEWFSLLSIHIMNFVSIVFQYFYPSYLIESFATSLTLLFIVLYVQRPERQVEPGSGLPSYYAFCKELGKIKVTGQNNLIVIVTFRNAAEMSKYLKDTYLEYLQSVYEQIRIAARRERILCEVYLEQPGTFYILLDDEHYNPVQAIPEVRERIRKINTKIREMGAQPDTSIITVNFPNEISDLDELLRFGHNFARFADYSRVFNRAEAVISQRSYQIEAHLDDILNRAVSSGGLAIRYQPMLSVKENAFLSAEAVIDLTDEVYGKIDPELLMSAAEERGLSVLLGSRVMDEVFAFVGSSAMKQQSYRRIFLRLSVLQCMQLDLTDIVWSLRDKYRIDPSQIAFEIKESSYERISDTFNENLKKLSLQGYQIVLDGFGRGYSNMQNLLDMPIQAVKLDQSVVSGAASEGGRAMLKGIIDMIRQIPREVIAQGADTEETAEMLCGMGCDLVQGLYYGTASEEAVSSANTEIIG